MDKNTSEIVEIPIEKIATIDRQSAFDVSKYEGKKVLIDKVEIRKEINYYVRSEQYPNGRYDPDSKEQIFRVYLYSEPLQELDNNGNFSGKVIKNNEGKEIRVNTRFNLSTDVAGNPVVSKHPKSKLWSAMRKLGINSLQEFKGQKVVLLVEASEEADGRKYLRLAL